MLLSRAGIELHSVGRVELGWSESVWSESVDFTCNLMSVVRVVEWLESADSLSLSARGGRTYVCGQTLPAIHRCSTPLWDGL